MRVLESFVNGSWLTPDTEGVPYHNAVTGATMGGVSSEGVDFGATVRFGREVGGPNLRELTFHQRASILRQLGKLLLSDEVKEELYGISTATGATRSDSGIDIDGGAGVLLTYASKGRRELPNATVALDGDVVSAVRVALTAVAPTIIEVGGLDRLAGRPPGDELLAAVAAAASEQAMPITDLRAGDEYRRHTVGVMARRAVDAAARRAAGEAIGVPVNRALGIGAAR